MEVDGGISSKKPRSKKRDRPTHASSSKEKHCNEGEPANVIENKQEGPSKPSSSPKDKKDKVKSKPRKKRSVSPVMVEDIIDGFAFASFKSFEDLEVGLPNEINVRFPNNYPSRNNVIFLYKLYLLVNNIICF